jgi:diaminohydroxyphosphoribosylaminopyrimidine deaminase/5-amino-6-(5-phosphoribosylamino)uracil reductase
MTRHFGDPYQGVADPYLRRAAELAESGRGTTYPNPLVGCVLVRGDEIVGEGFHGRAGGPHAEVVALRAAGDTARGATAYVTLEPCAHTGRTGPCADALIAAGVERVVIGMRDPMPVAAGGAERMRRAGIAVEFASDPTPFEDLNVEWLTRVLRGRPFIRVKVALTLDGRPALADGVRSSLTGENARLFTMRLRQQADAVLVGTGTIAVDDPSLTVRDPEGVAATRQPRRIVLSRTEQPPASARMFGDGFGPVSVLVPDAVEPDPALGERGVEFIPYDTALGLPAAFTALGDLGYTSLLVEAGPRLLSALVKDDLADELILLHAGGFAGEAAPCLFVGPPQDDPCTLDRPYRATEAGVVGSDAVTVWRPRRTDTESI